MRKIKTLIFSLVAVLIGLFTLCSCDSGEYNLYNEWNNTVTSSKITPLASLSEDNIYEVISLEDAETKINDKETFILVVSTLSVTACVYEIPYFDVTAKQLGWNGKVYYIDATEILKTTSARLEINNKLHISNVNAPNENEKYNQRELVVVVYKDGNLFFDTSNLNDSIVNDFYSLPSALQSPYESIAAYLFKDSALEFTCLK